MPSNIASSSSSSERPTLPPIRSLDLPVPTSASAPIIPRTHVRYDRHENSCPPLQVPVKPRLRQLSTSSSNTTLSRTPSPSPVASSSSRSSSRQNPSPHAHLLPPSLRKFTLLPCTLEEADAVVLIPPPETPYIPTLKCPAPPPGGKHGQALLLVGKAIDHVRHPQRPLAKGARVQPYRMVPGSLRRLSQDSTTSV
ncbi:hypothetical protein BDQ17DRAFT_1347729 [Cyathus striatus]|nr:hypothetical protein BDQ17DRAFT_1347729 [Cyathus striatus]